MSINDLQMYEYMIMFGCVLVVWSCLDFTDFIDSLKPTRCLPHYCSKELLIVLEQLFACYSLNRELRIRLLLFNFTKVRRKKKKHTSPKTKQGKHTSDIHRRCDND